MMKEQLGVTAELPGAASPVANKDAAAAAGSSEAEAGEEEEAESDKSEL